MCLTESKGVARYLNNCFLGFFFVELVMQVTTLFVTLVIPFQWHKLSVSISLNQKNHTLKIEVPYFCAKEEMSLVTGKLDCMMILRQRIG